MPFFSIIIPTKGRAAIIGESIRSVLCQSFRDFELLIVDNNLDEDTQHALGEFEDSRIRYHKTGGISMPQNWEQGYSSAKGDYLIILTDRMAFRYPNTLDVFAQIIKNNPGKIITYGWEDVNDSTIIRLDNKYTLLKSEGVLQGFFDGGNKRHWFNLRSPKGLNTVLPGKIYTEICVKYQKMCFSINPDFCMSFILLQEYGDIIYINSSVLRSHNISVSNGMQSRKNKSRFRDYVESVGCVDKDAYKYTPIPVLGVFNSMYNDFFSMKEKFGWDYTWDNINMVEYFLLIFSEILENEFESEKQDDLSSWEKSLENQPDIVKENVYKRINRNAPDEVKNLLVFTNILSKLKRLFR